MNLFLSLRRLLGRERNRAVEPLFGLTREQVGALKHLRSQPEWDLYLSTLDIAINLRGEAILSSRDDAALHEARGVVIGLRQAATLIDEILQRETSLANTERSKLESARDAADRRVVALYGSPGFGRTDTD